MKKIKLIVSDFHLGSGVRLPNGAPNAMEDFPFDSRFKEFLEYYSADKYAEHEVEIIFNGDMLNLIQVDYHGHYPLAITEAVSVTKTKAIIAGHPVFFKALKKFLASSKRSITYVIGNHDQELFWKAAREVVDKAVGTEITWKNFFHVTEGVHVEHGHQFEAINRVEPTRPFLTENLSEPILNLPWGTLFTLHYIIRFKMSRPFIDKVRPFRMVIWWLILHDTWFAVVNLIKLATFFISTQVSRSRYRHTNLRMTMKMLREASVFPDLTDAAKRILQTPDIHTVVFGHTHVYKHVPIGESKQYMNTGTWTDIVSLDLETFGRRVRLTYVLVEVKGKEEPPVCTLRHWIGTIPLEDAIDF